MPHDAAESQVGRLKPHQYQQWVYSPSLGAPRFFQSNLLESISKTSWYAERAPILAFALRLSLQSSSKLRMQVVCTCSLGHTGCSMPVAYTSAAHTVTSCHKLSPTIWRPPLAAG